MFCKKINDNLRENNFWSINDKYILDRYNIDAITVDSSGNIIDEDGINLEKGSSADNIFIVPVEGNYRKLKEIVQKYDNLTLPTLLDKFENKNLSYIILNILV